MLSDLMRYRAGALRARRINALALRPGRELLVAHIDDLWRCQEGVNVLAAIGAVECDGVVIATIYVDEPGGICHEARGMVHRGRVRVIAKPHMEHALAVAIASYNAITGAP